MWTSLLALTIIQGGAVDTPPFPRIECGLPLAIRPVERFADLPAAIRADILKDGAVAEAGKDFNWGDAILDRSLPYRRFVRAGTHNDTRWFVWLQHGGFDGHLDVIGYGQVLETDDDVRWARIAELSGEPCAATNAVLNGVTTGAHQPSNAGAIPRPAS